MHTIQPSRCRLYKYLSSIIHCAAQTYIRFAKKFLFKPNKIVDTTTELVAEKWDSMTSVPLIFLNRLVLNFRTRMS